MEGVDVVRQAAEEAALDLDQQAMQELVRELPDYETEVLEEGDAPLGPGEYPGSIPDSPPPIPGPVLKCPIHRLPLHHNVSTNGWCYVVCTEEGCPVWASEDNGAAICTEWDWQACDDVKGGPFTCHCDKPYKLVVCQNSDKGNVGRLFLTCRQDPPCKFFQWADQERPRKAIRAHHEVTGNTYSRENRLRRETDIYREPQTKRQKLIADAYARPVSPYRPSYGGGGGKRIEPKVQQLRDTHFERAEEELKREKEQFKKKVRQAYGAGYAHRCDRRASVQDAT